MSEPAASPGSGADIVYGMDRAQALAETGLDSAFPVPGPVLRGHACCPAAVTAMVADVGVTADAALVALTALAHRHHAKRPARRRTTS